MGRLLFSSVAIVAMGMGFAFLSHLLLARFMGPAEYGAYNFVYAVTQAIAIFALFGFQNSPVRFIPEYLTKAETMPKILSLIRFSRIFTFVLGLILSLTVFGILTAFGFAEKYSLSAFGVGIILTILIVTLRLNSGFLKGLNKGFHAMAFESGFREGAFFILLAGLVILSITFDSTLALIAMAAVWLLSIIGSQFFIQKSLPKTSESTTTAEDREHWISVSWPMMLSVFAQRFMRRSDIIILGLMVNPALVGIYALAAQFADVSGITDKAAHAIFGPRSAALYYDQKKAELQALYKKMMAYNAISTLALGAVIAAIAPLVFPFFGEDFADGYTALLILIAGVILSMSAGPVQSLMVTTGHERIAMKITLLAAIGNVIGNIPAIYYFGIEGAATVTSCFMIMRALLSYIAVKRANII